MESKKPDPKQNSQNWLGLPMYERGETQLYYYTLFRNYEYI